MTGEMFSVESFVWTCLWQSMALVMAGMAASFLLRRRSSRAHQVLLLSIVAAVTVPVVSTLVKHYELGVFVAKPAAAPWQLQTEAVAGDFYPSGPIAQDFGYEPGPIEGDLPPVVIVSKSAPLPWTRVALYGWIAASLVLTTRLLVTFALGVRLLGRAKPLDCKKMEEAVRSVSTRLGIGRAVVVCSSRGVRSPVIWCWRRKPVLLVPSKTVHCDNGIDWTGVLCHELAHWKRRDHISGLLAEIAVCILPWHLLLWWAKSRLTSLSEKACDDWVLATGQPGTDYADSLLDLAPGRQMAFVPAVVSSKKGLAGRIRRILKDNCGNPRIGTAWAAAVIAITICVALGVALAQTKPAKPDVESRETEPNESPVEKVGKDTVIQRFYKLQNCSPAKMSGIVEALLSDVGRQRADKESRVLLIIDTVENLKRIERIIEHLDIPEAEKCVTDIFQIYSGDPSDIVLKVARALTGGREERIASQAPTSTSVVVGPSGQPVVLIPEQRHSWIIAKASPGDMKKIAELIEELDKKEDKLVREYEVVNLRYADADKVAERLKEAIRQMPDTELQQGVLFQPLAQARQIIIFGRKDLREKVRKLIAVIDAPLDMEPLRPRIITLENSDPNQMVGLLTKLFVGEDEHGVNIYKVIFGENAEEKRKTVGPSSYRLKFEEVPGTKKIVVISNFPEGYDVVGKLILELDKQEMAAKDVKQVREWIGKWNVPLSAALIARPVKIAGLAKDQQGRPVPGVTITLFQTKLEYVTDTEGKFTAFLPSSDNMRYFFAVDKLRELVGVGRLAGGKQQVEINLVPARIVSGRVVGPAGRPVSGVQIAPLPMTCFHVLTDSEGRFDVGWSSEWAGNIKDFCLMARHVELNLAAVVDVGSETQTVDITLEPALSLRGTVEDANDRPILGAVVGLSLIRGWGAGTPVRDVVTNYQGRFELQALPQRQEYGVGANAEGYQRNAIRTGIINRVTQIEEVGAIILKEPDLSVSGIIIDGRGKPLANVPVYFHGEGQPKLSSQTDAEGRFTFDKVCSGPVVINAKNETVFGTVETQGGAKDVRLLASLRFEPQPNDPPD